MTWTDKTHLGPAPAEESCAQLGSDGYEERAPAECLAYIEAIKRVCGEPPLGARLKVEWASHDYGRYAEVVCLYDGESKQAAAYAALVDENAPTTWEAAGMAAPGRATPAGEKRYHGRRDEDGNVRVWVTPAGGESYPLPPRYDLRNHSPMSPP